MHRYTEFPFTPAERALLFSCSDAPNWSPEQLHGYDHPALDRSMGAVNRDFLHLDGQGIVKSFKQLYVKNGSIAVLDAGCGTGNSLWELISASHHHGGDLANIAADAISEHDFSLHSHSKHPRQAIMAGDIAYWIADLTRMDLPQQAYDLIYSYEVFPHITKPQLVIDSLWQALKPGGIFYFNIAGEQTTDVAEVLPAIREQGGGILSGASSPSDFVEFMTQHFDLPLPMRIAYRLSKPG